MNSRVLGVMLIIVLVLQEDVLPMKKRLFVMMQTHTHTHTHTNVLGCTSHENAQIMIMRIIM